MTRPLTHRKDIDALIALALARARAASPDISHFIAEIRFALGTAPAQVSATSIPDMSVIIDCEILVAVAYSPGATISVGYAGDHSYLQSTSDNRPQMVSRYVSDLDLSWVGPNPVLVSVVGAPVAGLGECVVRYVVLPSP